MPTNQEQSGRVNRGAGRLCRFGGAAGLLLVAAACSGTGTGQRTVMDAVQTQETVYNACQDLPIHQAPSGYSRRTGSLPFGHPIRVANLAGFYTPHGESDRLPSWAQIVSTQGNGFVAARCVVEADVLADQKEAAARAERETGLMAGGRGFSDSDDESDLIAARGAAGSAALAASAAYQKIDTVIDRSAPAADAAGLGPFLREGNLLPPAKP